MEIHETGELDEKLAESAFASHDGSSQGRCWSRREGEREREFRRNGSMISGNQWAEKSKQTRPVRRTQRNVFISGVETPSSWKLLSRYYFKSHETFHI